MPHEETTESNLRPDLSPEAFLHYADRTARWIADYLAHPERYPVLSRCRPGEIKAQLPATAPEEPDSMEAILADFERVLVPGLTHWNHPGFMAYFANSSPGPGILAETYMAALNQNAMLWRTSPAATELEEVVTGWLGQMLGLPPAFRGVITDTASISSLLAMAAAREAIPGLNIREQGLSGRPDVPRLCLYTSEQAHSSIEKGAITLGIGQQGVRKIATDAAFRMDPAALARAIAADRAESRLPFCVVATAGTTSTTAIDPVPEIAELCRQHGLWLHVDAAYGGSAAVAPEYRWVLAGCEQADSLVINPHKWLFTPMDCSVLFVQRPAVLKQAFSLIPDYLVTEGDVTNFMDWGVQLGRRFRALKLWMILRYFGHKALAAHIRHHIQMAQQFAAWVDAAPDFERMAPAPLSVICFRAHPPGLDDEARLEQLNTDLLNAINASGEIFLSHTRLHGHYTLRLAIGNLQTQETHVARAWQQMQDLLGKREKGKGKREEDTVQE